MTGLGNLMYNLWQMFGLSLLLLTTGKIATKLNKLNLIAPLENMNAW